MKTTQVWIAASIVALAGVSAVPSVAADPDKSYVECGVEFVLSQDGTPSGCQNEGDISPFGTEFDECTDEITTNPDEELVRQCVIAL